MAKKHMKEAQRNIIYRIGALALAALMLLGTIASVIFYFIG